MLWGFFHYFWNSFIQIYARVCCCSVLLLPVLVSVLKCNILIIFRCRVVLTACRMLHNISSNFLGKLKLLYPLNNRILFLFSRPRTTTTLSKNWTTLFRPHISSVVFVLLWLAYFTYNILKIHACCSMCQNGLPF